MSSAPDPFLETALALPQSQRADLAFQLLQSLDPPGEEISAEQFSASLHERVESSRVESSRSGNLKSHSLHEESNSSCQKWIRNFWNRPALCVSIG